MDRRQLIKSSAFLVPALLSGRSHGFPIFDRYNQDCGVASGDPSEDGFVVWTRLPPAAQQPGGTTTAVQLEVATVADFNRESIVYRVELETSPDRDYTVKTRVRGLQPKTIYYYRFSNRGSYQSVVGRSKTTPSKDDKVSTIKVAFVSCQNMSDGLYTAFNGLASEDVDVVLHLGDHVYEKELGRPWKIDPLFGAEAETLEDYRVKYRYYLSDPAYREVRRLFPWIDIWDDHEVVNDYAGSVDRSKNKLKFQNAYQAFSEYMPFETQLKFDQDGVPELPIFRKISYGKNLDIIATDNRQYRSPRPSRTNGERHHSDRTMLGKEQKEWTKNQLAQSDAQWKIVMTGVMMTPLRLGLKSTSQEFFAEKFFGETRFEEAGYYMNLDQWDGFTAERRELLEFISQEEISNVIFTAGDIHAAFDSVLYLDPDQTQGPATAVEIVTSSISSKTVGSYLGEPLTRIGQWILARSNPQIVACNIKKNGYAVLSISEEGTAVRHMMLQNSLLPGAKATAGITRWIPNGSSILV